ncbi:MAG: transporter, family, cyanate transporter [Thermoleophilales bacterium]|nr:transporter, family, cyanate transporter [Thermoleophilales bacterium]
MRSASPRRAGSSLRGMGLLVAGLMLAAFCLRTAMGSVPPILDGIRTEFGLSATAAGILVSVPVLCLAAGAPLGPVLGRRLGDVGGLAACMLAIAAGSVLRAAPSTAALFAGTILATAATGVAGVLVPAIAKRLAPERAGRMTGFYTALLVLGTSTSSGVVVPLADAFGGEVRPALAVWAVPPLIAGLLLGWRRTAAARPDDVPATRRPGGWIWRDPVARWVTAFLSFETIVFYGLFSWLPSIAQSHGVSDATAGAALGIFSVVGLPMALVVPALADRWRSQSALAIGLAVVTIGGLIGLLASPADPFVLWATILGASQGGAFGLALTLLVLRAPDAPSAAELAGMAQTVAYVVAATVALLLGVLHDATGSWTPALFVVLAATVGQLAAGLFAGRDRFVVPPRPMERKSRNGPDNSPRPR